MTESLKHLMDESIVNTIDDDSGFDKSSYFNETDEFKYRIEAIFSIYTEKNKYLDKSFDPLNKLDSCYVLKRASDYKANEDDGDPIISRLFTDSDVSIENIQEGGANNSYMLQCLISIAARFPEKIRSLFPFPNLMQKGVIVVKLWDSVSKDWRLFHLDDQLPMKYHNIFDIKWLGSSPSGPNKNLFWCSFIEKSMARITDSYSFLDINSGRFQIEDIYKMILGDCKLITHNNLKNEADKDYGIRVMIDHYKIGSVISLCSSQRSQDTNNKDIKTFHGYALLDIRQNVSNTNLTLIKCFSTLGKDDKWLASYCIKSDFWNSNPGIRNEVGFNIKKDGVFWIESENLYKAFDTFWIAYFVDEKISDMISVDSTTSIDYKSSQVSNKELSFTLYNDTNECFKLMWINFSGHPEMYETIWQFGELQHTSNFGNVYLLKSLSKSCVIIIGRDQFIKNDSVYYISSLKSSCSDSVAVIKRSRTETVMDMIDIKSVHLSDDEFTFTLYNDTEEDFEIMWIDYSGNECLYGTSVPGKKSKRISFIGHMWQLSNYNLDKEYVFKIGTGRFKENNITVNISSLI